MGQQSLKKVKLASFTLGRKEGEEPVEEDGNGRKQRKTSFIDMEANEKFTFFLFSCSVSLLHCVCLTCGKFFLSCFPLLLLFFPFEKVFAYYTHGVGAFGWVSFTFCTTALTLYH